MLGKWTVKYQGQTETVPGFRLLHGSGVTGQVAICEPQKLSLVDSVQQAYCGQYHRSEIFPTELVLARFLKSYRAVTVYHIHILLCAPPT